MPTLKASPGDGLRRGAPALPSGSRPARAIENQLRNRSGYALIETRAVRSKDGVLGKQFRFGRDEGQTPHLYYVAVFVTPKRIQLLELGGTKEIMTRQAAAADYALANFTVD